MKPIVKGGVVIGGYVAAALIAFAVLALYTYSTSGPDRQTYGGMFAFGDSLLFLAVFGVAAIPSTGAALYFLRPYRRFWLSLSVAALAAAATGIAACVIYVAAQGAGPKSALSSWSALAVLRILVSPLFVLAFFISVFFAPSRSFRIALLIATGIEAAACAYIAFTWFHPFQG